jgi:hypothetical protein
MRRTAIALSCGVLVLAGCTTDGGSRQPVVLGTGQAAVSQDFRVSQSEVDDGVAQVLTAQGQPPGEPPAGLASATAQRILINRLVASYAEDQGIELTRTQVEEGLAQLAAENGGQEALNDLAAQSGIPPEDLDDTIRTNLLVTAIGLTVDASGDQTAQLEATLVALAEYSEAIDVQVAPRYGTWDDAQLQIVPGSAVSIPGSGEQATS